MICQRCRKDKPLVDFGLTSRGTPILSCKRCTAISAASAKARRGKPVVVVPRPVLDWVYNGRVYGEKRV